MAESRQDARADGNGNVVVQIVGAGNAVTIAGAERLILRDYRKLAEVKVDAAQAGQPGWTATGRRETGILYPHNLESLPLQGRETLLNGLKAWLRAETKVSVHVLIGGGGRGKTRLAAELAAWARDAGWTAGFAARDDLDRFRQAGFRTRWEAPTLAVVDYAAAKSVEIKAWLRALAQESDGDGRFPLRLLLLERQGGEGYAWWREVFGGAGVEGDAVRDLLAVGAPATVGVIDNARDRHAVFAAAFAQASDKAAPAPSPALDEVLARASLGGEPLFLAMFGLIAARQGLEAAKALPADRIALDLAGQELERIGRIWESHGLPVGRDRPLHRHLAALATLSEGLSETDTHAAVQRECDATHRSIPAGGTEA
ncbi:MAG: hypothetical protein H7841_17320, partial [Magnetospirillum sp. WYHS-4]